ncbi:DUF885 family protein [Corynebacterium suedekumii]|nr:DUF885 family protein [Corynebacterium suedekumii]
MGHPRPRRRTAGLLPDYWGAVADRTREMIADVDAFDDGTDESDDEDDFDEVDHVTAAVLRDRLCLDLDLHHHGENLAMLNNIASPVQTIRDTLILMPSDTPEQIDAIRSRLSKVEAALAGYRESSPRPPATATSPPCARSTN